MRQGQDWERHRAPLVSDPAKHERNLSKFNSCLEVIDRQDVGGGDRRRRPASANAASTSLDERREIVRGVGRLSNNLFIQARASAALACK